MKVLLVSMPFAALERPALGISLLKAALQERGVPCDIAYLNLAFARHLGPLDYTSLAGEVPYDALAGEWVFARVLFGAEPSATGDYVRDVLSAAWRVGDELVDVVERARAAAPGFLDEALRDVPWGDYDLVGFTSYSQQNVASLALARRIRERHPGLTIVFGGGNWQAGMGVELHRRFPFVDLVCQGEADESFPDLVTRLASHARAPADVPGLVYRAQGTTRSTGQPLPVRDLDALPLPDFGDYLEARRRFSYGTRLPAMVLETSRGCWWAGRDACLFCGLNGASQGYRTKSPARIVDELRRLVTRYPCSLLDIVDNVVSPRFLTEVLPRLAERPLPAPVFFETRPQVTREQVRAMGRARAKIQPGLESLSDHVLALMHKGTTALENVRLLKWCRAYGVDVLWNMLYGFPGETEDDYESMISLLPWLHHLEPPGDCGPLRLDRFSRYYREQRRRCLADVRPLSAYSYIYPFPAPSLARLAYAFDYSVTGPVTRLSDAGSLRRAVAEWQAQAATARLTVRSAGQTLVIRDERAARMREHRLMGLDADLYRLCDDITTPTELTACHGDGADGHVIRQRLDALVGHHLMLTDGERYLALAVPASAGGTS